jgi:hypothetical protein
VLATSASDFYSPFALPPLAMLVTLIGVGGSAMSQLQLKKISKEIFDRVEQSLTPAQGLSRAVDDYFIQELKQAEMHHAEVDARLYEGLRRQMQTEVLPLYEEYHRATEHIRERKDKRKLWHYVLGTVAVFETLEAILTHGRSIVPQVLFPTAVLNSFIGFIIYTAAQYLDDRQLARARGRLDKSVEGLETKVLTDVEYDQRRQLMDTDVLRAETMEILTHYTKAEDFWRDYLRVREMDPTVPAEVKALNAPAFDRFLRFHVEGQHSAAARAHRFDRLFIEAHEVLLSRDRVDYAVDHLKSLPLKKS